MTSDPYAATMGVVLVRCPEEQERLRLLRDSAGLSVVTIHPGGPGPTTHPDGWTDTISTANARLGP